MEFQQIDFVRASLTLIRRSSTVKCCGRVSNETEKNQADCVWSDEAETN